MYLISSSDESPWNAFSATAAPFSKFIRFTFVSLKASIPTDVTFFIPATVSRFVQPLNTPSRIKLTWSGIVIFVNPVHSQNA